MGLLDRSIELVRGVARDRNLRAPRAYWVLRSGPERALTRAGRGPIRERERATIERPGAPRLPADRGRVRPTVLFYAINGTGLGHLTRCLAIARHLGSVKPVVVTTSMRADVLDDFGVDYVAVPPFASTDGQTRARWNERLHRKINDVIADHRPAVAVFDGVAPDPGFTRALRGAPHIGRVAIRRAYRLDGRELLVAERDAEMDLLIVPHETGTEAIPLPEGPHVRWVGSVCLTDRSEAMTREDARAALGLSTQKPSVIVQLGARTIGGGTGGPERLIEALAALDVDVRATSYSRDAHGNPRIVTRYPLAPLYPAFDLAIAASGYNTFTELMHLGVPSVFVPNEHMRSDDQLARARRAGSAGAALVARHGGFDAALVAARSLLADPDRRRAMSEAARAMIPANGAHEAARVISGYCEEIVARRW